MSTLCTQKTEINAGLISLLRGRYQVRHATRLLHQEDEALRDDPNGSSEGDYGLMVAHLARMQTLPIFMNTKRPFGKGFFLSINRTWALVKQKS